MTWMSKVNGQVGEQIWKTDGVGASSKAKTGRPSACRKLESAQVKMGRRSLGASNTVAEMAVQGDLWWRKLEERREGMKVMFSKRLRCWKREDW